MKKTLLVLLSLVLCVSLLTGCASNFVESVNDAIKNTETNGTQTEGPNAENNPTVDNHANKQIAIDSFNKIDLTSFGDVSLDYFTNLTNS